MPRRFTDFELIVGHVWRCTDCRDSLLTDPETFWIGYKLSETQRECILNLSDGSFHTVMKLSEATELTADELYDAIDHPRARLRHLGSIKGEYHITRDR